MNTRAHLLIAAVTTLAVVNALREPSMLVTAIAFVGAVAVAGHLFMVHLSSRQNDQRAMAVVPLARRRLR